jgi:hypothetical protein
MFLPLRRAAGEREGARRVSDGKGEVVSPQALSVDHSGAAKYVLGVLPSARLNMEMKALGLS